MTRNEAQSLHHLSQMMRLMGILALSTRACTLDMQGPGMRLAHRKVDRMRFLLRVLEALCLVSHDAHSIALDMLIEREDAEYKREKQWAFMSELYSVVPRDR